MFQDFGDYQDGYYSVQTTEGEQIAQLIAGYIDIILKKVKCHKQYKSLQSAMRISHQSKQSITRIMWITPL